MLRMLPPHSWKDRARSAAEEAVGFVEGDHAVDPLGPLIERTPASWSVRPAVPGITSSGAARRSDAGARSRRWAAPY